MTTQLIQQAKEYNNQLKQIESEASEIKGKIKYGTEDLARRCAELSILLGVTVTEDNLESLYQAEVTKVKSNLATGTAILNQIRQAQLHDKEVAQVENTVVEKSTVQSTQQVTPSPVTSMRSSLVGQAEIPSPIAPKVEPIQFVTELSTENTDIISI